MISMFTIATKHVEIGDSMPVFKEISTPFVLFLVYPMH